MQTVHEGSNNDVFGFVLAQPSASRVLQYTRRRISLTLSYCHVITLSRNTPLSSSFIYFSLIPPHTTRVSHKCSTRVYFHPPTLFIFFLLITHISQVIIQNNYDDNVKSFYQKNLKKFKIYYIKCYYTKLFQVIFSP